ATAGRLLQVARPWSAAPTRGLAVASHLCMQTTCRWPPLPRRQRYFRCQSLGRSYIPVFQIWMKKMKEVKHHPL
ncbi:hypothetical protein B296_00058394, partial [Ensete ventricosum]